MSWSGRRGSVGATGLVVFVLISLIAGIGARAAEPLLHPGDVVTTGFSGTVALDPGKAKLAGTLPVDLTFIDATGTSARIIDGREVNAGWDARVITPTAIRDITAEDIGQVFGIAIDDAEFPNIYLGATSAFGLNLVVPGAKKGDLPQRVKTGMPRATWMRGQFGLDLQGGPGSIWKVDGVTGDVTLFANVTLNGVPNPGPALGALAYDADHRQLFAVDRYSGMIHRFALDGADLGHFDHGVDGRTAGNLDPVPFDPAVRPDIASPTFDTQDPASWDYAPTKRQVWGLAVHDGRLFYAVADGPQIWSVGIDTDGSFLGDARWELDLPATPGPYPVSDMTFSASGAMILAQRAPLLASYDYSTFTAPAEPQVLVYWLEDPDDPVTPSRWMPVPEEYAVGFPNKSRLTDGGVDLGYGFDAAGALDTGACDGALWTTGDALRDEASLASRLLPGGPLHVDGLQLSPADQVRNANTPPWLSGYIDYDGAFDDLRATGHMGSVRVLRAPCTAPSTGAYGGPPYVADPPYVVTSDTTCVGDDCNPPPEPKACFATSGVFGCDSKTGQWVYRLTVNGPGWIDSVAAVSLSPAISVPGSPVALNPADIPVSGAPGASGSIDVCGYSAAAEAIGKPYDCCHVRLDLTLPTRSCEVSK